MSASRYRAYGRDGEVVAEGSCGAGSRATFTTDETVTEVRFYSGNKAEEAVAGTIDFGGRGLTGEISVTLPSEEE